MSLIADTTLFYEPILEEYGYTKADYVKSVGKYMEDPEKFADIFKESKKILDDQLFCRFQFPGIGKRQKS